MRKLVHIEYETDIRVSYGILRSLVGPLTTRRVIEARTIIADEQTVAIHHSNGDAETFHTSDVRFLSVDTVEDPAPTSPRDTELDRLSAERDRWKVAYAEVYAENTELRRDKERLDWLDSVNTNTNERNQTAYGWEFEMNHNRAALTDHNFPPRKVREAIDLAIQYAGLGRPKP